MNATRAIGYYAFVVGQIISMVCLAALIYIVVTKDPHNHPTYILASGFLIGQLPLLFLLRMKLVETGQTLGQFVKDVLLPILPWGKKTDQS